MKAEALRIEPERSARSMPDRRHPAPASLTTGESDLLSVPAPVDVEAGKILRFQRSERLLHWSIAIPFMVCYTSAAILMLFFNLHSEGIARGIFSWTHRIAGACLMVLPGLILLTNLKDARIHLYNIRQGWVWALSDVKWLLLMGPAAVIRRITLPEQGKFNAAEKLNFMMVMSTYPFFIATGLILWMPGIAFYSWILHVGLAAIATPLMFGHIFMALVNPGTRVGLSGMLSGYVDRQWAKHHYRRWYRENFECLEKSGSAPVETEHDLHQPVLVRCSACRAEHTAPSWLRVLEAVFELQPLTCPSCGLDARIDAVIVRPGEVNAVRPSLELAGFGGLVVERASGGEIRSGLRPGATAGRLPLPGGTVTR